MQQIPSLLQETHSDLAPALGGTWLFKPGPQMSIHPLNSRFLGIPGHQEGLMGSINEMPLGSTEH